MARPQPARHSCQGYPRRRSRSGSLRAYPRLDPAGGPAARALRRGGAAAARRRRDRPPPARHPFPRLRAAWRHRHRHQQARIPCKQLHGADVFLDEPSVTATENALVAAVAAKGTTYLRNAASEPHVQDLANFLVALGAKHRGHRHQHHDRARPGDARRSQLLDPARPYRGRLADRACRGDALAAAHRARRRRASALDPDGLRAARHRLRGRGRRPHRAVRPDA